MGNLGMPELILIMVLALLLFGPKKLPEIGKSVGKALGEFKRASNDLKRTIEDEMDKVQRDEPGRPIEAAPVAVVSTLPHATLPHATAASGPDVTGSIGHEAVARESVAHESTGESVDAEAHDSPIRPS